MKKLEKETVTLSHSDYDLILNAICREELILQERLRDSDDEDEIVEYSKMLELYAEVSKKVASLFRLTCSEVGGAL